VNSHDRYSRSSNSSVEFQCVFTSIIGSTTIRTLAVWESMNPFRQPGVSVIDAASILCYMMANFRTSKTWSTSYFLNYLCWTRFHGRHRIDSSVALFSKSLTLPNVYALILSKLLITLMGLPRVGAAFYTETAHEWTQSQLYDVRHSWYVVPQSRPLDCRGLKCWLQLACQQISWESIISCIIKQTAGSKLKTIEHVFQMYG